MSSLKISPALARETLWYRSNLSFLLDENQKALYELFHKTDHKIQTWLLARRSGKTRTLCVLAVEQCLKHPKSIVKFLSPTKKQVERNIRPLMSEILESCPDDLRPQLKTKDDIYYFGNGSEIQLAGSDGGNIDSLRGGFAHICIIDEAQNVSKLRDAINGVLLPTTSTTQGKILLAGTPPSSYDHEFLEYVEQCSFEGSLVKRTVYDNPRMPQKEIDLQAKSMGGFHSEDFRREYLCEIIKSSNNSVVPEFTEEKALELVKEWPRPVFYAPYTAMDLGYKDFTVVLFGYYDFKNDKVVIEDEIVTHGINMYLATLGQDIQKKEETLWVEPLTQEIIPVKKRVSDHDLIAINEIRKATNNKIVFTTADKSDKMAGINFMRTLIKTNKLIINPRCTTLIHHLKNGRWAKSKDTFARCSMGSHYDAIDSAQYLIRAMDYRHNPYPKDYGNDMSIKDTFYPTGNGFGPGGDGNKQLLGQNKLGAVATDIYKKILNIKSDNTKDDRKNAAANILINGQQKKKGYFNRG